MAKSGIYRIDGPNGKFYIGSAKSLSRRWIEHKRDLRKGVHANPKLQAAWSYYGEEAFTWFVLEVVEDKARLIEREQVWLDAKEAVDKGYNVLRDASSRLGLKASEETRRKQSEAHKGRKHGPMSEAQKQYYSDLYRGKKLPIETRMKMSESRKGRAVSEETKAKISASHTGRKASEEARQKMSAARLGTRASDETKLKMSQAQKERIAMGLHNFSKGKQNGNSTI